MRYYKTERDIMIYYKTGRDITQLVGVFCKTGQRYYKTGRRYYKILLNW
jgi:hypothetical protein